MMNKPRWIIEGDVLDAGLENLLEQLKKRGSTVDLVTCRHFVHEFEPPLQLVYDEPLIYKGSITGTQAFHNQTCYSSPITCTWEKYLCTHYYAKLYTYLLNKRFLMIPYGLLKKVGVFNSIKEFIAGDDHVFIRPNSGAKSFSGTVIPVNWEWVEEVERLGFYDVEPEALTVLSRVLPIKREWRLFIAGTDVISATQYKENGKLCMEAGAPHDILNFAKRVLKNTEFQPDPVWVLDVCETPQGLSILEIGAFSPAGLYEAPLEPIITAVEEYVCQNQNQQ